MPTSPLTARENGLYVKVKDYDTFTEEIDLTSASDDSPYAEPDSDGRDGARYLLVLEPGTLGLRFWDGSEETFTIESIHIGTPAALFEATLITAILSSTDVEKVRVRW